MLDKFARGSAGMVTPKVMHITEAAKATPKRLRKQVDAGLRLVVVGFAVESYDPSGESLNLAARATASIVIAQTAAP